MTTVGAYCNASDAAYELPEDDDFNNGSELHELLEDADLDLGTVEFQKYEHNFEAETCSEECSSLHLHAPRSLYSLVEGIIYLISMGNVSLFMF